MASAFTPREGIAAQYARRVRPRLSAELVFGDALPASGAARGPCPLHGGRGPNFDVDRRALSWRCYSRCSSGGDELDFLAARAGLVRPGARLEGDAYREAVRLAAGLAGVALEGVGPAAPPARLPPPARRPEPSSPPPAAAIPVQAIALWAASQPADGTPAGAYVRRRGVWPEPLPLPPRLRWLPREAVSDATALELPAPGAGAVGYAYGAAQIGAWQLEALTADGRRLGPERWRRAVGKRQGLAFRVRSPWEHEPWQDAIAVAEGELTALAAAVVLPVGEARAVGGASGLRGEAGLQAADPGEGRAVILSPDGDRAGRDAARELAARLEAAGRRVRADDWQRTDGRDLADELAEAVAAADELAREARP